MSGQLWLYSWAIFGSVVPFAALLGWAGWLGVRRARRVGAVGAILLAPSIYFVVGGAFDWLRVLDVLANPSIDPVALPNIAYEGFMEHLNCPVFAGLLSIFSVAWLSYWTGRLGGSAKNNSG